MTSTTLVKIALFVPAGVLLGAVYFGLLLRTVRLHAAGAAAPGVAPLYLLRIGLAVAGFWFAAQQGALPLLAALAGFLVARYVMQRRYGRA
jgi:F1F0 ATPase subunit 2